ncbi:MAG: DUF177 domain-containing protein [Actinobacteria bacterium]|nr:DUF177 domain-containing protein [Actinomycetota bacterium]
MRVPVTDLIGRPGATKPFTATLEREDVGDPGASWGPADDALRGHIELDLDLDSVVEGILVRGDVTFTVELPCARCLEPQSSTHAVTVAELFPDPRKREDEDEDDPGYEIVDDLTAIDLSTLIRDAVLMDLPVRVLCREDCLGLCPVCGADRNTEDCGHRPAEEPDPRWAALADLDLPDT